MTNIIKIISLDNLQNCIYKVFGVNMRHVIPCLMVLYFVVKYIIKNIPTLISSRTKI